jgi:hypothetical protein
MCLEDTPIDRPYAVDAMAREWSIHGMADQSVRLCVGDTLASPSTVFHMVDDPNHAQAEAGSPFERLADNAFSGSISHNLRMSEEICQVGTIRIALGPIGLLPVLHDIDTVTLGTLHVDKHHGPSPSFLRNCGVCAPMISEDQLN